MDTASYLRRRTTVVFNRPRDLVSIGAAMRWQRERRAAAARIERETARRRAWSNNPDNSSLTARRREELRNLALDQPDRQGR